MTGPGAGAELKHLLKGVKSKASKPLEALNLNDKGIDLKAETFDLKALGEAMKGANSNRQTIAVWSPEISAVVWYLKKTTPEFSISDEARSILEEGLQEKYPDLYKLVTDEMEKGN
jgi:hypothetical protein